MSTRPPLSPDTRALLDRERAVPPVPAAVRARALNRARAALAEAKAAPVPIAAVAPARRRWLVASAAALLASAAVGAAAYEIGSRFSRTPTPLAVPPAPTTVAVVPARPHVAVRETTPEPAPAVAASALSPVEAARAELRLLRQERAAVARGDFEAALEPIAEHTRRFKNGRLAEEREALRVKALSGLGRTDEARRAAAAFRVRFPRSVLLPAVSRMPASGP